MKRCLTVLIVDDTALMRLLLRKTLEAAGLEIVGEAIDGLDAIEQYQSLKPDIIIMDIIMPKKDGIEAAKAIISLNPLAKIILISTIDRVKTVKEALSSGACRYIVKPVSGPGLIKVINDVFE